MPGSAGVVGSLEEPRNPLFVQQNGIRERAADVYADEIAHNNSPPFFTPIQDCLHHVQSVVMKPTLRAKGKQQSRQKDATGAVNSERSKKPSRVVQSLRAAQKDLTRSLLMKQALELFNEKGYANTTVDDIAASAGTTRTTFYQHFKSKGELTQALIVEVNEILTSADDPPLASVIASGSREAIRDWVTRKVNQWTQIRPYVIIAHQAAALENEIEAAIQQWYRKRHRRHRCRAYSGQPL